MKKPQERSLAYQLSIDQKSFAEMTIDELNMVSGARYDGGVTTTGSNSSSSQGDTDSCLEIISLLD